MQQTSPVPEGSTVDIWACVHTGQTWKLAATSPIPAKQFSSQNRDYQQDPQLKKCQESYRPELKEKRHEKGKIRSVAVGVSPSDGTDGNKGELDWDTRQVDWTSETQESH